MIKYILTFLLFNSTINAQSSLCDRYLSAAKYINNSSEFYDAVRSYFNLTDTSYACPSFSNDLIYLDYNPFLSNKSECESANIIINEDEKNDVFVYKKKHYFDSFKQTGLNKLGRTDSSNLVIYFSKPINNYLLALVIYDKNNQFKSKGNISTGKVIKLLFLFNETNDINAVCYGYLEYN